MVWWEYYWEWLKTAFSKPWIIYQIIAFIALIIGLLITRFRSKWVGRTKPYVLWIPIVLFTILFLAGIITAPYRIYLEQYKDIVDINNRVTAIEKQKFPSLS